MRRIQRRRVLGEAVKSVVDGLWNTPARRRRAVDRQMMASLELLEARQLLSVPAAPSNASASTYMPYYLNVSWTDNSNNETGFTIERATDPSFAYDDATTTVGANVTSTTLSGLIGDAPYYIRVRATNSDGSSSNSSQSENSAGTQKLVVYTYLGMSTIVAEAHPEVSGGLTLSYNFNGSYSGWDRFGRIVQQLWKNDASTTIDGYTYTYNRAGDRVSRSNVLNSSLSETYSYDGLDRLVDANRNGSDMQSWGLDALGNWGSNTTSSGTQTRTANAANEITGISGSWAATYYDAAGNMTYGPKAGDETTQLKFVYDAWNRLKNVSQEVSPGYWLVRSTYWYDGLGRLVSTDALPGRIEYYYNENNQIVESQDNAFGFEGVSPSTRSVLATMTRSFRWLVGVLCVSVINSMG